MRGASRAARTRPLRAAVVVCLVAMAGWASGVRPAAQPGEPRTVEITARRFAFEPAEIDAVVGERLRLVVRSGDGVHGLEIKRFRVKQEVPRGGDAVAIEFTPTSEGRFPIICSEFCGNGHDDMRGMLVVRSLSPSEP